MFKRIVRENDIGNRVHIYTSPHSPTPTLKSNMIGESKSPTILTWSRDGGERSEQRQVYSSLPVSIRTLHRQGIGVAAVEAERVPAELDGLELRQVYSVTQSRSSHSRTPRENSHRTRSRQTPASSASACLVLTRCPLSHSSAPATRTRTRCSPRRRSAFPSPPSPAPACCR